MIKLGKTSKARLATCHPRIRYWIKEAIKTSPLDFGVVCGYRSKDEQTSAYANGKSNAPYGASLHNFMWGDKPCSLAVDVMPYADGDYLWHDDIAIKQLYDHLMLTADRMGLRLIWGGDFDKLIDKPHWEIMI